MTKNCIKNSIKIFNFLFRFISDTVDQADDGIGTSDDETNSNSSTNTPETNSESSSSPNMGQSRRVIKLDLAAISQLLAFDEVCAIIFYWQWIFLTM